MKTTKLLAALALCGLSTLSAHAASITQNFDSNWTIAPWDYFGDIAAQQWQYLNYAPWDASLGALQSVSITTSVSGTRDAADALGLRYAFFTGWTPNQYQFSAAETIAAGSASFASTTSFVSGTDFALSNFLSYLYLPQAYYFFESRTNATHTISASTELVYNYEVNEHVSEPASELLMLAALVGLAIAIRRKMPEKT
ncbi:MAG: hypothetical protein V4631_06005 [Pseudomonadota bacterium]